MSRLPNATHCLACGYLLDAAAAVDGEGPREPGDGDVSICIQCGAVALYEVSVFGVTLRRPTPEEWLEIDAELGPLITTVQSGIEKVHGR